MAPARYARAASPANLAPGVSCSMRARTAAAPSSCSDAPASSSKNCTSHSPTPCRTLPRPRTLPPPRPTIPPSRTDDVEKPSQSTTRCRAPRCLRGTK